MRKIKIIAALLLVLGTSSCEKMEMVEPDPAEPREWVEVQVYSRFSLATVRLNGDLPRVAGDSLHENLTVIRAPRFSSLVFERIKGDYTTVTIVRYRGETRSETEFGNVQFLKL